MILAILILTMVNQAFAQEEKGCGGHIVPMEVRGDSMAGLLYSGATISALIQPSDCLKLERNDFIIYLHPGHPTPIVKIIKGLPGDFFEIRHSSAGENLVVNGLPLRSPSGELYQLSTPAADILALYEKDYAGRIPSDSYLMLGTVPFGSLDSTRFGLARRENIAGKVTNVSK